MRTKSFEDMTKGPGLVSTAADIAAYVEANLREQSPALRLVHRPTFRGGGKTVALTWNVDELTGELYHTGTGWGCNSVCLFSTKSNVGVVLLANETANRQGLLDLANTLFTRISPC